MGRFQSLSVRIRRTLEFFKNGRPHPAALPGFRVRDGYDRWAACYGQEQTALQALDGPILAGFMSEAMDCRVLDLGCGTGRITELAVAHGAGTTVAVDFSWEMLRRAARSGTNARCFWLAGDGLHLPFAAGSFDVVICALMLGHVQDLAGALAQIHRVLRPGGALLISDFHPYATLRGDARSFVDPQTGQTYAIEQYCHLLECYITCFNNLGMHLTELREPCFKGYPLAIIMRAEKLNEPDGTGP